MKESTSHRNSTCVTFFQGDSSIYFFFSMTSSPFQEKSSWSLLAQAILLLPPKLSLLKKMLCHSLSPPRLLLLVPSEKPIRFPPPYLCNLSLLPSPAKTKTSPSLPKTPPAGNRKRSSTTASADSLLYRRFILIGLFNSTSWIHSNLSWGSTWLLKSRPLGKENDLQKKWERAPNGGLQIYYIINK